MAILIQAQNLSHAFGGRPLFTGLNFTIESGDRVALIGPNGAGKSTLLRMIAEHTQPDSGELIRGRGLRLGYLEQIPVFTPGHTVEEAVLAPLGGKEVAEEDWQRHAYAMQMMTKLGLMGDSDDPSGVHPASYVDQLSGGLQKRVALARELAKQPELLLMDEPTNHLDVENIMWLESFIAQSRCATLIITHDRLFLQRTASRIIELDKRHPQGLFIFRGGYQSYLETKATLLETQARQEVKMRNTLRRELEWLSQGVKARGTKDGARIDNALALQSQVKALSTRNRFDRAEFEFHTTSQTPKRLIEANHITKKAQGRTLFSQLDLVITHESRIGILGRNGCGKSTLLRVLMGEEKPDAGHVFRSDNLQAAYFQQTRNTLNPEWSVLKTLCPKGEQEVNYAGKFLHIHSYLSRFLFTPDQGRFPVGHLSGGEQSRLLLALLMLRPANLLILDEPTNDLDMDTLELLQTCVQDFQGAVLTVSHDRYFLDQVSQTLLAFDHKAADSGENGQVHAFASVGQWENWVKEQKAAKSAVKSAPGSKSSAKPAANAGKLTFTEQHEYQTLEPKIAAAEAELATLNQALLAPENASDAAQLMAIDQSIQSLTTQIDTLYARWQLLEEKRK